MVHGINQLVKESSNNDSVQDIHRLKKRNSDDISSNNEEDMKLKQMCNVLLSIDFNLTMGWSSIIDNNGIDVRLDVKKYTNDGYIWYSLKSQTGIIFKKLKLSVVTDQDIILNEATELYLFHDDVDRHGKSQPILIGTMDKDGVYSYYKKDSSGKWTKDSDLNGLSAYNADGQNSKFNDKITEILKSSHSNQEDNEFKTNGRNCNEDDGVDDTGQRRIDHHSSVTEIYKPSGGSSFHSIPITRKPGSGSIIAMSDVDDKGDDYKSKNTNKFWKVLGVIITIFIIGGGSMYVVDRCKSFKPALKKNNA